jgi:signal transduction histidine kinase/CheY-like chemotaxis protein
MMTAPFLTDLHFWSTWLIWLTAGLVALLVAAAVVIGRLRRRLRRQQRSLQDTTRDLDLVMQSMSDNVTLLDRDLRVVWTNWARRARGYSNQAPQLKDMCHAAFAGRAEPCAGCPAPAVLRTGRAQEGEVVCRNGRLLRLSGAPVRDDRGTLTGVVLTARDITEKRRLAERLQQAHKLEAVGQLAAGVAHDLNNSLQVILGYADLLAAVLPGDSEARVYVGAMNRAGRQARDVVRQLLTFSHKRLPSTEWIDLGDWVGQQADIMRRLLGEDVEIRVAVAPALPRIPADPAQLGQALLNLCTNARDAMPGGGCLELAVSAVELAREEAVRRGAPGPGTYVVLSVADEGEGIAPELHDRIFDPFFTTKDVDRGTGLGLAAVYGIVTAHRGYVELESEPGRGATFRLGWPVHRDAADAALSPPTGGASLSATNGAGSIMVIDGDPEVRRQVATVLRDVGHRVDEAPDGPTALARLADPAYACDVLVLDANLAGVNSWSLYRQARRRRPDLRAVLCSDHAPARLEPDLPPPLPGIAYLQKPYEFSELTAKVAALSVRCAAAR